MLPYTGTPARKTLGPSLSFDPWRNSMQADFCIELPIIYCLRALNCATELGPHVNVQKLSQHKSIRTVLRSQVISLISMIMVIDPRTLHCHALHY
jgi:hypothetical protein